MLSNESKFFEMDNLNEVCRICLLTSKNLITLFNDNTTAQSTSITVTNNIVDKIMACASVQIVNDEELPSNICNVCLQDLNIAYNFKQKCEQSNIFLIQLKHKTTSYFIRKNDSDKNIKEEYECDYNDNANDYNDDRLLADESNDNAIKLENIKIEPSNKDKIKLNEENEKVLTNLKNRRTRCKICLKEYSINHIYRHMRVHSGDKPFTCHICGKSFNTSYNRDRHIKIHTGDRPYKCSICLKTFIQQVTLKAHVRIHTGEQPFKCTICSKTFKQSRLCKLHIERKHFNNNNARKIKNRKFNNNENKKYTCTVCNKTFTNKTLLLSHVKLKHTDTNTSKTFLCCKCGKTFTSQVALNIHNIVHTGVKSYQCTICSKSFAYSSSLKTHLLRHTGEKRFSCHLCGNKFLQSAHLKTHLTLHSGDKPFKCTVCSKTFSLKGNLIVHQRIHTGETPYTCAICTKGFYDSSSLKKHLLSHSHQIQK